MIGSKLALCFEFAQLAICTSLLKSYLMSGSFHFSFFVLVYEFTKISKYNIFMFVYFLPKMKLPKYVMSQAKISVLQFSSISINKVKEFKLKPEAILCSIVINLGLALGITNQVTPLSLSF